MTPEELKAERAALEVAIGERARMIERLKTAEISSREEVHYHDRTPDAHRPAVAVPPVVTKSVERKAQAMNDTAGWQKYIDATAKRPSSARSISPSRS